MDEIPAAMRRTPAFVVFDEINPLTKCTIGERALLAAMIRRALADAKGIRLGSDAESSNNHVQRESRKWFRDRRRDDGGWGWIIEHLDLPMWFTRIVEKDATIDGRTRVFNLIIGGR